MIVSIYLEWMSYEELKSQSNEKYDYNSSRWETEETIKENNVLVMLSHENTGLQNTRCIILLPGNIYFCKSSLNTQSYSVKHSPQCYWWVPDFGTVGMVTVFPATWLEICCHFYFFLLLFNDLFLKILFLKKNYFFFLKDIYLSLVDLLLIYRDKSLFPSEGWQKCACSGFSIPFLPCSAGQFRTLTNPSIVILLV